MTEPSIAERVLTLAKKVSRWWECKRRGRRLPGEYLGLCWEAGMDAATRFDESRGVNLETFLVHRMVGAIHDWEREVDPCTRRQRQLLAAGADVPNIVSLDHYVEQRTGRDGSRTWEPPDVRAVDPAMAVAFEDRIGSLLSMLPRKHRAVMTAVYRHGWTVEQAATLVEVSESRGSQLCSASVEMIQQRLLDSGDEDMAKVEKCTKVPGCQRPANHRGPHVGPDGHKIKKEVPPPAAGDVYLVVHGKQIPVSSAVLAGILEPELDKVREAISKFNAGPGGEPELRGVVAVAVAFRNFEDALKG